MRGPHWRRWSMPVALLILAACDGGAPPAAPSTPQSFLAGTWHGTVTIQVNEGDPDAPPPTGGAVEWTFEAVPKTNLQTFRTTIHSQDPWLPSAMTGTTALTPQNVPPTQISTQGEYDSPRGCRGTFASVGSAEATRIEADFTGVDCNHATFIGRVVLTKN